ncbi:MAG TPA: alpha/beta hydrolase [Candidatus Nanoarchaeia archaeon]|nr:alpha/beta hydrolase [Candidatus Nanoarchaeia archaeon]
MNCIIVHGSNDCKEEAKELPLENERHWMPWIKKELEKRRIKVSNELYPKDWLPDYKEWKNVFEKNKINEETVLIGHSSGGGFLVRWLSETQKKVKKLILVAPAIFHSGWGKSLEGLLKFDINPNIKNNVREIILFVSLDDEKNILKSVEIFSKALDIKPIIFDNYGHFTESEMRTKEFPELLAKILS